MVDAEVTGDRSDRASGLAGDAHATLAELGGVLRWSCHLTLTPSCEDTILQETEPPRNPGPTVSGGFQNRATGGEATVSGGAFNQATDGEATVSGGDGNTAESPGATISGGQNLTLNNLNQFFAWEAGPSLTWP